MDIQVAFNIAVALVAFLGGWAFSQGGSPLFRPEALHRITPKHLWMIAK